MFLEIILVTSSLALFWYSQQRGLRNVFFPILKKPRVCNIKNTASFLKCQFLKEIGG